MFGFFRHGLHLASELNPLPKPTFVFHSVLLEVVNFHNYGVFKGLLVRKNYGEFTIEIMVNFVFSRFCS